MNAPFFPSAASTLAPATDHLYFFLLSLSLFTMAGVFVPLIWFLLKYRRGRPADRTHLQLPTNTIEITWTVIPTLITLVIFTAGASVYFNEEVPPADFMEVNVVGKQWMWKIEHQEGNREINELHVPVGRAIKLTMGSEDVIHSFYVPAFRIKQDIVPGRFATEWFQPTHAGVYRFYCSEYCGMDHAKMDGFVYVLKPDAYNQWLNQRGQRDTLAQSGEKLYRALGCSGCHDGHSSVPAPPMDGLFGAEIPLNDGTTVLADERYLRDSILQPAAQIAAGYPSVMPTYQGRIREEQLMQLIAYIKSVAKSPRRQMP